jgi:hypothetical protein
LAGAGVPDEAVLDAGALDELEMDDGLAVAGEIGGKAAVDLPASTGFKTGMVGVVDEKELICIFLPR